MAMRRGRTPTHERIPRLKFGKESTRRRGVRSVKKIVLR
jgi:hypothetical protein